MDEREWLTSTDPQVMLQSLRDSGKATDRKLRLLLCTCCRQVWFLFQGTLNGGAVDFAERQADGRVSPKELRATRRAVGDVLRDGMGWREEDAALMLDNFPGFHFEDALSCVTSMTATIAASRAMAESLSWHQLQQTLGMLTDTLPASRKENKRQQGRLRQCSSIRDLFGPLPFRPLPPLERPVRAWNDGIIVQLATAIYGEPSLPEGHLDNARLAVLGDALEEAGCTDPDILGHLRQQGAVHVRGCWLVDLILSKDRSSNSL